MQNKMWLHYNELFHDGDLCHMEFRTNQGTGFYMIGTTVKKELMVVTKKDNDRFFTKDFSQDVLKSSFE